VVGGGELPPDPPGLGQLAAELRAAAEPFERGQPPGLIDAVGPELERAAGGAGGIPVRVDP
jgi:hypothetical protein